MKTYLRLAIFFSIAAVIVLAVHLVRRASTPESSIIATERNRMYASRDEERMEKDPIYAQALLSKLQFLDYRTAVAYNEENKPDAAISILDRLIKEEEGKGKNGTPRHSRSYQNEARWYEALERSYHLKQDEAGAKKAAEVRSELMARAQERKDVERRGEGRQVGRSAD